MKDGISSEKGATMIDGKIDVVWCQRLLIPAGFDDNSGDLGQAVKGALCGVVRGSAGGLRRFRDELRMQNYAGMVGVGFKW